jgi:hypothetical protein
MPGHAVLWESLASSSAFSQEIVGANQARETAISRHSIGNNAVHGVHSASLAPLKAERERLTQGARMLLKCGTKNII